MLNSKLLVYQRVPPFFHVRGWLRAQNPSGEIRFLPMEIQGVPVLSRTGAERQREARQAERDPGGTGDLVSWPWKMEMVDLLMRLI